MLIWPFSQAVIYIQHSQSSVCPLVLSDKNSVANIFAQYDVLHGTTLLKHCAPDRAWCYLYIFHIHIFFVNCNMLTLLEHSHSVVSVVTPAFIITQKWGLFCCIILFCQSAPSSLASNYRTNCWFVSLSYFDPMCLYSIAHLSLMTIYSQFFPHIVPPSTNMFLQQGQQCITFSLSTFSLPLDPLHRVQLQLQCSLSSHPNLFALSSPLSLVLLFSISIQLSSFHNAHIFFTLFCFYFSSVLEVTSGSPCVRLCMFSALTISSSRPLSPIKSQLKCSLPDSEGSAKG